MMCCQAISRKETFSISSNFSVYLTRIAFWMHSIKTPFGSGRELLTETVPIA